MSLQGTEIKTLDEEAITNFREYLKIPSVHPNVNYDKCVKFLQKQAQDIGLACQTYSAVEGKPIVILTWLGTRCELPSILLNSHMDVAPVDEDKWTFKPFEGNMDETGNIYARGSQDMKSVGIQYIEAIKRLKRNGLKLKRTIHLTFVPDEEIGGEDGMKNFVESDCFNELNIGVAFDESMASSSDEFILFFEERSIWQFHVHTSGVTDHTSNLVSNTAGGKMKYMLNKLLNFSKKERRKLLTDTRLIISDVTSIKLTVLKGAIQSNVLPSELRATFDCRIPVTVDHDEWAGTLEKWCKEAGEGVWIEYKLKYSRVPLTNSDNTNPYRISLKEAADELNIRLSEMVCPGSSDAKYIRKAGLPVFGFSPINNTPLLSHGHDEYLNVKVFLNGVTIYCKIIEKIANME
ncbi:hypothetical protein Trydic_g17180 [Trypoxylus dichotomus]